MCLNVVKLSSPERHGGAYTLPHAALCTNDTTTTTTTTTTTAAIAAVVVIVGCTCGSLCPAPETSTSTSGIVSVWPDDACVDTGTKVSERVACTKASVYRLSGGSDACQSCRADSAAHACALHHFVRTLYPNLADDGGINGIYDRTWNEDEIEDLLETLRDCYASVHICVQF